MYIYIYTYTLIHCSFQIFGFQDLLVPLFDISGGCLSTRPVMADGRLWIRLRRVS